MFKAVRKTTIEVDRDLVARASAILGARGLKGTIQRALEEVISLDARRRFVERLRTLEGLDLDDAAVLAQAWR